MGDRHCCVKNCRRRSHDHHGRKIPNGLTFHCFPAWRRNEGGEISELTCRRRTAWVAAVGRSNITFDHIPSSMRVCSRHFHSGKPAYEMLESDPDWVPSLHMGHGDGKSRRGERLLLPEKSKKRKKKLRLTAETRPPDESKDPPREPEAAGGGPSRSAVRPRKEVRSLLKSVLQHQTFINMPSGDKTQEAPAAEAVEERTELSFRDFFRESLEASLEASSRSRALSARQFSSSSLSLSLSSSCLDCVRLQRSVEELQEKLSLLTGEQEDTEASAVSNKTPVQLDEDVQMIQVDEDVPEWAEPLSPPEVVVHVGDEDVHSDGESDPVSSAGSQDGLFKYKRRPPPRFQKAWLKTFWFLRYSEELDEMWCHACRCYGDKSHHNLSLVKGSKTFKIQNIKKHSCSNYHKESVERHLLTVCDVIP